ncbi:MAG: dihydrofolate reductase family protein [Gemmatimonadota bacterium]
MAKLIYTSISSLDGYVADTSGRYDWAAPDEEVHAFINDLERPIGTYLYGRRLYETMLVWEHPETFADEHPITQEFAALWKSAEKIVYSRTLERVSSARTRIERSLEPESVRQMKARAQRDISIGGAELAGQAIRAGLVDECQLFLSPIIIGGGTRSLPSTVRVNLELLDERRFGNGVMYLRYRIAA